MSMRDLIPWSRSNNPAPAFYPDEDDRNPFLSLHREVNRLFDDVFRGSQGRFPALGSWSTVGTWPNVEISEGEKELKVIAELPGLEEKDIELLLNDGVLTIRGEKRSETEDKQRQFSERYFGRFERRIALSSEIEEDQVDARFKNGILTITVPKSESSQSQAKRISVKS
jgi:HSP20 family protein